MELDKRIRYSFSGNYINIPRNGDISGQLFDLVELAWKSSLQIVAVVVAVIDSVGPIRPMRLIGLMGRRLNVARYGVADGEVPEEPP
jgi:hypothetical protein